MYREVFSVRVYRRNPDTRQVEESVLHVAESIGWYNYEYCLGTDQYTELDAGDKEAAVLEALSLAYVDGWREDHQPRNRRG